MDMNGVATLDEAMEIANREITISDQTVLNCFSEPLRSQLTKENIEGIRKAASDAMSEYVVRGTISGLEQAQHKVRSAVAKAAERATEQGE